MASAFDIRQPLKALRALVIRKQREADASQHSKSLSSRLSEVFLRTWDLGLTAFGGPPAHFHIIYARFVEGKGGERWLDEQTVFTTFSLSLICDWTKVRQ